MKDDTKEQKDILEVFNDILNTSVSHSCNKCFEELAGWNVIDIYSREEAIEDGVLFDVSHRFCHGRR